jgi:hypothetical protein
MRYGKFRGKANKQVLARYDAKDKKWYIVKLEKKEVRVHRFNNSIEKEKAKKIGVCLKEVETVVEELSNDKFKTAYTPADYAAVDIYEDTPEPRPAPRLTPVPKS